MSSTFEHLDIEFEEINKLGIAEIIALKGEGGVLSEQVKQTLLNCFRNVAWVDDHGQEYVDALRNALYPPAYLVRISATYTQSGTIYPTDSLDDLREDLVVTATYSNGIEVPVTAYVLSGTLQVGESIITVSYGGKIAIFEVEVTRVAETYTITNNLTGASNSNSVTYVTEGNSYSATITANESHTLDGATISITMGGVDITSTAYDDGAISIAEVTGDLVITVVAVAIVLESISAVYTQSGDVYKTDSLDVLRTDLVVTAIYSDSSTETVPSTDYTLSGILEVGTSTIYVLYGDKTDTFNVTVSEKGLPSGYTQYDYISNTGSASDSKNNVINTGINSSYCDTKYIHELVFAIPSGSINNNGLWGSRNASGTAGSANGNSIWVKTGQIAVGYNGVDSGFVYNISGGTKHTVKLDTGEIYIDGSLVASPSGTRTSYNTANIKLFGIGQSNDGVGGSVKVAGYKLYSYKIIDSTTDAVVADFVPCTDPDSLAGVYDKVSETFRKATNASTMYFCGNDEV